MGSGTEVRAARAGYVERVQQGMVSVQVGTPGNLGPLRDFYLHGTPAPGIQVGAWVQQGQHIINSDTVQVDPRYPLSGPHLHFEVQYGFNLPGAPPGAEGHPLDPVPVLEAAQPLPAPPPASPPASGPGTGIEGWAGLVLKVDVDIPAFALELGVLASGLKGIG